MSKNGLPRLRIHHMKNIVSEAVCPICKSDLVKVEVAINRKWWSAPSFLFSESVLEHRRLKSSWVTFMTPYRSAEGLLCTNCGVLVVAPMITE